MSDMKIMELVGKTPIVSVDNIALKLEYFNPTGSHKDRIAMYMLKDVKKRGIKEGSYVVEYTSGNTGISVAWASKFFGYKPLILVPENIVKEKVNFIKVMGGEVILVPEDMDGHLLAEEIAKERKGTYLDQMKNEANFQAHYETTAPELYYQVNDLECFVMGAGTGGTIYGIGKYLKERNENIKIVLLIPKGSFLQEELLGRKEEDITLLEGFSYASFSDLLKRAFAEGIVDDIQVISSQQAIKGTKALLRHGIPGGFTSGANFYYAQKYAKKEGCKVATIVADSIVRYPSLMHLIL